MVVALGVAGGREGDGAQGAGTDRCWWGRRPGTVGHMSRIQVVRLLIIGGGTPVTMETGLNGVGDAVRVAGTC
jgi:hypothetical protein